MSILDIHDIRDLSLCKPSLSLLHLSEVINRVDSKETPQCDHTKSATIQNVCLTIVNTVVYAAPNIWYTSKSSNNRCPAIADLLRWHSPWNASRQGYITVGAVYEFL